MNLTEQLSIDWLAAIEKGDAPFKYIPSEIGELKFCYTDNSKSIPYSQKEKTKKLSIWVVGSILVAILCWITFNNSPIFNSIISVIAIFVVYKTIRNITKFKGKDCFVGNKGFAFITFEKNRDNITSKSIYLYEDLSELITGETVKKQNGAYVGTDYFFGFFAKPDENNRVKLVLDEGGSHNQQKPKDDPMCPHYTVWKKIEEIWTLHKLEAFLSTQDKEITFSLLHTEKNDNNWHATPYITISPDAITVGNREYNKATLKNVWFENGNIVIEHINHSKKLFGLIEKGNIERIPLTNIGNQKLFMLYLSSIIKF